MFIKKFSRLISVSVLTMAFVFSAQAELTEMQKSERTAMPIMGRTIAEVLRGTGKAVVLKNTDPEIQGNYIEENFPDYKIKWFKKNEDKDFSFLVNLILNKKGFQFNGSAFGGKPLVIGVSTYQDVIETLGSAQTDHKDKNSFSFFENAPMGEDVVTFIFENNILKQVKFEL